MLFLELSTIKRGCKLIYADLNKKQTVSKGKPTQNPQRIYVKQNFSIFLTKKRITLTSKGVNKIHYSGKYLKLFDNKVLKFIKDLKVPEGLNTEKFSTLLLHDSAAIIEMHLQLQKIKILLRNLCASRRSKIDQIAQSENRTFNSKVQFRKVT